jgi:hypothetical protein
MSAFENLLLAQTEKQLSILQDQSHYYPEWLKHERKLIDKYIIQESFTGSCMSDNWEIASFHLIDNLSEIKGRWMPASSLSTEEGVYLSSRILRCTQPITLKSLSAEVRLDFKLATNSEIWIITRGVGVKDPNAAILRISKESEIDGIFIVFGSPIGDDGEFVFFKRQQVPEEKFDPNEDFTSLDVRVKDNGDDRIHVSVRLSTLQSTVFQTYCNKFIPALNEGKVMVAGYGRNVLVKTLSIQQKERTSMGIIIEASKRQQCCNVF